MARWFPLSPSGEVENPGIGDGPPQIPQLRLRRREDLIAEVVGETLSQDAVATPRIRGLGAVCRKAPIVVAYAPAYGDGL
ncbi:hypothetical protein BH20ACT23_BH20ACT23_22900 [soil metagenome]